MTGAERDAIARLEQVLQQMQQMIRAGDFSQLDALSAQTEAGLGAIGALDDRQLGARLHRLAERNAACLQAAARGLRAARRRLADITAARAGMKTYDGNGLTTRIGGQPGKLTQRI